MNLEIAITCVVLVAGNASFTPCGTSVSTPSRMVVRSGVSGWGDGGLRSRLEGQQRSVDRAASTSREKRDLWPSYHPMYPPAGQVVTVGELLKDQWRLELLLIGEWLARPSLQGTVQFLKECLHDPAPTTDELVEFCYQLPALPGVQASFLSTLCTNCNLRGLSEDVVRSAVDNLAIITAPTLIVWG
jgi:hypothetical protein